MPTYEYVCQVCKNIADVTRKFDEPEISPECDQCGDTMKRTYGTFGIQFKGTGFYKTDSK